MRKDLVREGRGGEVCPLDSTSSDVVSLRDKADSFVFIVHVQISGSEPPLALFTHIKIKLH